MNRRRISVALIAASATALALVTPAQAEEAGTDPAPAPASEQQVQEQETGGSGDDQLEDGQPEVDEPEDEGSSFMGPMDLLRSIASGNGSSGVPGDENDDVEEEEDSLIPEQLQLPLAIITAVLSVGATVAQVAAIVLPIMPGGLDMLRDLLAGLGIQVPADAA